MARTDLLYLTQIPPPFHMNANDLENYALNNFSNEFTQICLKQIGTQSFNDRSQMPLPLLCISFTICLMHFLTGASIFHEIDYFDGLVGRVLGAC